MNDHLLLGLSLAALGVASLATGVAWLATGVFVAAIPFLTVGAMLAHGRARADGPPDAANQEASSG